MVIGVRSRDLSVSSKVKDNGRFVGGTTDSSTEARRESDNDIRVLGVRDHVKGVAIGIDETAIDDGENGAFRC